MAVELKSIPPTPYLTRDYYQTKNLLNTYSPEAHARMFHTVNVYPRRETVTPIGYEATRMIRDTQRTSMSRDRSSLSVDRMMYSRGFSQPPVDKLMRYARHRMSVVERDPFA